MTIKMGVIGLGRWGPNHIRTFNAMRDACVVAAADSSAQAQKRVNELYPTLNIYADYRDLLDREDISAVAVATPTSSHYKIVKAAILAGKHVLCEKPLTARGAEAWELVALAQERQRHLVVGHVFLFNPGIEYLARAVQEGQLGRLFYLNAVRTNLGPFRYDVNAAWDLASHDVYIFNHLLQERPISVSAMGGRYLQDNIEDIVFMTLEYGSGVLGHVHVSWLDPKKVRQITVVGEQKMITWDDMGSPGPIMIYDRAVIKEPCYNTFGEFQLLAREGDVVLPRIPAQEPLAVQAREFIKLLNGASTECSRGRAQQGAEVVDVLEAASRSLAMEGRRTPIYYKEVAAPDKVRNLKTSAGYHPRLQKLEH
jgi:predicted dehydrogenase